MEQGASEIVPAVVPDATVKGSSSSRKNRSMSKEDLDANLAILQKYAVLVEGKSIWVNTDFWSDEPDNSSPMWSEYTQKQLTRALTLEGMSNNDADRLFFAFKASRNTRRVDAAHSRRYLPLHPSGFQSIGGVNWFTANDSSPLQPVKGNPAPVLRALTRMFGLETPLILGWLKGAYIRQLAYAAKVRGQVCPFIPRASQTLAVCGNPDTGKTHIFLDCIVKGLLGPYAGMPASWLKGESRFNDWALTSNIFVADDGVALQSIKDRRHAATLLKQVGYSSQFAVECKNMPVVDMPYPNERIFVVNLEEFALKALPAYEENIDKYLFLWNSAPAGFNEDYNGDYEAMNRDLIDAIPAFAHFLLYDLSLPDWATSATTRHSVADWGFMSPMVLKALSEQDEAGILFSRLRGLYLCERLGTERFAWNTQGKIRELLKAVEFKPDCTTPVRFGKLMHVLCNRYPDLIHSRTHNGCTEFQFSQNSKWEDICDIQLSTISIAQPDTSLLHLAGLSLENLTLYPDFASPQPPPYPNDGFSLE